MVTVDQIADAVIATNDALNKNQITDVMSDLQDHVGFRALTMNKVVKGKTGRGETLRVVLDHNNNAEHSELYDSINYNRDSAMATGRVPWRYTRGHMFFDSREESMNSGAEELVNAVQVERARMMTSIFETGETAIWTSPANSDDNSTPWGIPFWVQKNATLGFNGGEPSGFASGRAGISDSRYKNYTGQYTTYDDVDATGLLYQMEKGAAFTKFKAASPLPGMEKANMGTGIFCNWVTKMALKQEAKKGNDSLGWDLATQEPTFKGHKIQHVPYLDADSTNPLYMLDFSSIYGLFLKNWHMREINVKQIPNQPECFAVVVSMVWNIACSDLRKQAVFYK